MILISLHILRTKTQLWKRQLHIRPTNICKINLPQALIRHKLPMRVQKFCSPLLLPILHCKTYIWSACPDFEIETILSWYENHFLLITSNLFGWLGYLDISILNVWIKPQLSVYKSSYNFCVSKRVVQTIYLATHQINIVWYL